MTPAEERNRQLAADRRLLTKIDEHAQGLTTWEVGFVESCLKQLDRGDPLTVNQRPIAERLDDQKVR